MDRDKTPTGPSALAGIVVLDASRMLPGAVLARMLVDLGARVIKIEDPTGGDPLRHTPPLVGDTGAGFCALLRGCESVALDLQDDDSAATLRRIARHVDVVAESFRPGTMEGWGLGAGRLLAVNPRLVVCSLSGFGGGEPWRRQAAHDLNFGALCGLTARLGGGVPRLQIADVTSGILAATAILAALLARTRSGRGAHIDQPLAAGPLPFMTWAWADAAAGGGGLGDSLLAGRCPAYRTYACADGLEVAVAALEPKFWAELARLLDRPHLAGLGLDTGPEGETGAAEAAQAFRSRPRAHWLALAVERGLPVTAVHDLEGARRESMFRDAGLLEPFPLPPAPPAAIPGPFIPSLGRTPGRPAPRLGEHTAAVLRELA